MKFSFEFNFLYHLDIRNDDVSTVLPQEENKRVKPKEFKRRKRNDKSIIMWNE